MKLNVMYFARYREALGVDRETVEGEFATTPSTGVALARQLVGYPNGDEPAVPFIYDATDAGGILDGFYVIESTDIDWSKLAAGTFAWTAALLAVPGSKAPLAEVRSVGAARTTAHSVTPWSWIGMPDAAVTSGEYLSSLTAVGAHAKTGPSNDSAQLVYAPTGTKTAFYADAGLYTVTAAGYYYGAARIERSADSGSTWSTVIGRELPIATLASTDRLRLSVGFMRFTIQSTGTLTYEVYDGSSWDSKTFTVGYHTGSAYSAHTPTVSASVLQNGPEAAGLRFWIEPSSGYVDFTVRRGSWVVEVLQTSTAATRKHAVSRASAEAATAVTGGIDATSADASGNKYQLRTPHALTADTTNGFIYQTSAAQTGQFAIALDTRAGDGTTTGPTTTNLYFAAMRHRQRLVAR